MHYRTLGLPRATKCARCGDPIVRRLAYAKFCSGICRQSFNNAKRSKGAKRKNPISHARLR